MYSDPQGEGIIELKAGKMHCVCGKGSPRMTDDIVKYRKFVLYKIVTEAERHKTDQQLLERSCSGEGMQDGEGQTTEHLCTIPAHGQQGGVNFGRGEGAAR